MKKNIQIVVIIGLALLLGITSCSPAPAATANNQTAQDLLIKSEVETAVSMLQVIADRQQAGEMTAEEARSLGAELLRGMTYGAEGYFWADTEEGVNVVLYGRPDVEGRNRLNDEDGHGNSYVKTFIETAKSGGGYVEYWFTKKGENAPLPKRSYVLLFEPFGWVVGSGYYK
jgi:methyl-accepting chemotaxis protein